MIKVKYLKCLCNAAYAAAVYPACEKDAAFLKSEKKAVSKGHSINFCDVETFKFSKCSCKKQAKVKLLKSFS